MSNNPWRYAQLDPNAVQANRYLNSQNPPEPEPEPEPEPNPTPRGSSIPRDYILMPQANTYAQGLHALQEACVRENNQNQSQIILPDRKKVYRANTFLENIIARMTDWQTLIDKAGKTRTVEDRKRYFNNWLDSCCGIAYKANSSELKLDLISPQLMGIAQDYNQPFLPVDYASFPGQKFDSSKPNFVRDAWLYLLDGQGDVYDDYLRILKEISGRAIVPNFWVRSKDNLKTDQLRAVYVSNLDNSSNANCFNNLGNYSRFLRVAPS